MDGAAVAGGSAVWYSTPPAVIVGSMLAAKIRRPFVLFLALALAMGLVTHSVPAGNSGTKAADMSAAMSMDAATNMPMSGNCDDCGDDQKAMGVACAAYCNSVVALSAEAAVFEFIATDMLRPSVSPAATGHTAPPDPYPPRPIGMS